jgi:hypothetical protein
MKSDDQFPKGWDEERVKRLVSHYDEQTDEQAAAEDEAALESVDCSYVEVPVELVPAVRDLIAHRKRSA